MQLYDISIAVNASRQLDAPGNYIYFLSGSAGGADSTVTLRGLSSGLRIILKPGQAFRLEPGKIETSWVIGNFANTAPIVGTVLVGMGEITDNRVTGSVEVIDGGLNRTLANTAFATTASMTPSTITNNAAIQIFNNAGVGGKNLIVEQITFFTNVASCTATLYQYYYQSGTVIHVPISKLSNGLASTNAKLYGYESTFWIGNTTFKMAQETANKAVFITPKEPFVITPGWGLQLVDNVTTAHTLTVNMEYYEQ